MYIFIPSKGRAGKSKLIQNICDSYISGQLDPNITRVYVVVENQDYDKYLSCYLSTGLSFIVLPEDNKGISYVRNFIKDFTERNAINYYWQLDDDISGFYERAGTKLIKGSMILSLAYAHVFFVKNGVALGALEYQQLAWCATKDAVENSFCDVCVWVDNLKTTGLRYRDYVEGKEDRDFAMQVIKSGQKTSRYTLSAFAAPANGSNAGGLKEIFYDLDKEEQCVDRMVELWGSEICQPIVKKNGRRDVKINWKKINSNQASLF